MIEAGPEKFDMVLTPGCGSCTNCTNCTNCTQCSDCTHCSNKCTQGCNTCGTGKTKTANADELVTKSDLALLLEMLENECVPA